MRNDTVPRVTNLYCFYVENPPKRVALGDGATGECLKIVSGFIFSPFCAVLGEVHLNRDSIPSVFRVFFFQTYPWMDHLVYGNKDST